jgi:hypothetical protein
MTFVSTSYLASSTKTTRTFQQSQQSSLLANCALRQGAGKRRHWRLNVQSPKLIVQLKSMVTWTTSKKKIRVEGMQSQVLKNRVDAIKTNVDAIRTQIELMQKMESIYVRKMGQSKYDDMIVSLINQSP